MELNKFITILLVLLTLTLGTMYLDKEYFTSNHEVIYGEVTDKVYVKGECNMVVKYDPVFNMSLPKQVCESDQYLITVGSVSYGTNKKTFNKVKLNEEYSFANYKLSGLKLTDLEPEKK